MLNAKRYTLNHNRNGFTPLEILIVLALIGILATLTVFALRDARQKTRENERVSAVNQIRAALDLGFVQLASYPSQTDGDLRLGGVNSKVFCEVKGSPQFVGSSGECSGIIFLPSVPSAPSPSDGKCSSAQNYYRYKAGSGNANFNLEFCLGKAASQSGLIDGLNCATPSEIRPGACK